MRIDHLEEAAYEYLAVGLGLDGEDRPVREIDGRAESRVDAVRRKNKTGRRRVGREGE